MPEPITPAERPRTHGRGARPQAAEGRRWWVRYGIAFLFAVLVVNAVAGERGYLEWKRLERRHADAAARLAARRAENASLQKAIHRMRTDPSAVEEAVRRQLGYSKPGELVFTVREPRSKPVTPQVPPPSPGAPSTAVPQAR